MRQPLLRRDAKEMCMTPTQAAIESVLQEHRLFPPPPEFAGKARIKSRDEYNRLYRESIDQPEKFWGRFAEELHWFKKWDKVLDWKPPHARWFVGGKTNLSWNCLDRQIEKGRGQKVAIQWEGEPEKASGRGGDVRRITYSQLKDEVSRFANGLKHLGVKRGDRVTIYMPMIPQTVVAMLACARIGARSSSPRMVAGAAGRSCH
jgi:acetyl-CoA synthetase